MKQVWSQWAVTAICQNRRRTQRKDWAAKHGASPQSVVDEGPQHRVALRSFALGKYDVIRAECAAFVRETRHPPSDECGKDSFKWNKQLVVVSRVASSISHEKKKPR